MNGYTYIDDLKIRKLIKKNEYEWLSHIFVYVNNEVVYKVALQFDYNTLKKSKKYGIENEWRIFKDEKRLVLDNVKAKIGPKILKYNVHDKWIEYFEGEDL